MKGICGVSQVYISQMNHQIPTVRSIAMTMLKSDCLMRNWSQDPLGPHFRFESLQRDATSANLVNSLFYLTNKIKSLSCVIDQSSQNTNDPKGIGTKHPQIAIAIMECHI